MQGERIFPQKPSCYFCYLQVTLLTGNFTESFFLFSGYFTEGLFLHFVASMISGLVTTFFSMPVDIAKTRYVNGVCISMIHSEVYERVILRYLLAGPV